MLAPARAVVRGRGGRARAVSRLRARRRGAFCAAIAKRTREGGGHRPALALVADDAVRGGRAKAHRSVVGAKGASTEEKAMDATDDDTGRVIVKATETRAERRWREADALGAALVVVRCAGGVGDVTRVLLEFLRFSEDRRRREQATQDVMEAMARLLVREGEMLPDKLSPEFAAAIAKARAAAAPPAELDTRLRPNRRV